MLSKLFVAGIIAVALVIGYLVIQAIVTVIAAAIGLAANIVAVILTVIAGCMAIGYIVWVVRRFTGEQI